MKNIIQILVVLSVATFCYGETNYYTNRNTFYTQNNKVPSPQEWSEYTYNLYEGHCTGRQLVNEEVSKEASQYTVKKTSAPKEVECAKYEDRILYIVLNSEKLAEYDSGCCQEYTWTGRDMFHITCINVENKMTRNDKAAEARITKGGVGQGNVSIEMLSKNSQGIKFRIEIWGESTTQQTDNVAVLTNTPDKVLYMGGKKYCECR